KQPQLASVLKQRYRLEDFGLRLRNLEGGRDRFALESDSGIIPDTLAQVALSTAKDRGYGSEPVLSYLANAIRVGDRVTPYSLVTARGGQLVVNDIALNEWAAQDLAAKPGDAVTLDYFVWKPDGRLDTASAQFRVARI